MIAYQPFTGDVDLRGKVAVVTGAANGIGKATATLFAKKGASVALVDYADSVGDVARQLADTYQVDTLAISKDLTAKTSCEEVVAAVVERFGTIDILSNIAGAVELDDAENIPEEYWDKLMDINAKATFKMSQQAGRVMIRNGGGKIVNITSQAGFIAIDKHVAYTASKAAVIGMTKVMALEWAEYGINVNAFAPTVVLTEMGEKAWQGEVAANMKKLIPCGRFAYPDEIAAAVLFLSSSGSNMITGENLVVDGGFTIK